MNYPPAHAVRYRPPERLSLLAKLFIAILLIVVFEGALRKWVSDGLTYPIVALRDGIAAYGVLWALVKGRARYSPRAFQQMLLVTVVLVLWGLLQVLLN